MIVPPECGFIQWLYAKYGRWEKSDSIDLKKVQSFLEDLLNSRKIETWNLNKSLLIKQIIINQPENFEKLTEFIYLSYNPKHKRNTKVIGDKNNYFINHLYDLKNVWPKAKYIMLIRDVKDVVMSYLELSQINTRSIYKPNLPIKVPEIADKWLVDNSKILDFFSKESVDYHILRFEDLICHTKSELTDVCDFLELNYRDEMLKYHLNSGLGEPNATLDWKKLTLQPPDRSRIGRYRDQLSKSDIEFINSYCHEILNKFDYK